MNFKAIAPLLLAAVLPLFGADLNPFAFPRMEKSIVMDFYGLRSVEALSPTELQVVFGASLGGNYRNPASYYIVSFDDQVYNYTKMVMPLKVAELKESLELKTSYAGNFQKTTLRLTLPFPMKAGNQYAVATSGITFGRTGASLIYRPNARGTDGKTENPMDTLGFRGFENLGESCLRLMFGPAFNPQEGVKIKNYTIKLNGTSVPFEMISTRAVIDGHRAQGNPLETILRHDVFVRLVNAKVKNGDRVQIETAGSVTNNSQNASLIFNPKSTITSVLHVDEYGYLPNQASKEMYLFCWMGNLPTAMGGIDSTQAKASALSISYPAPMPFSVFKETDNKLIFSGRTREVPQSTVRGVWNRNFPSEKIYSIDLTPVTVEGTYFISIDGIGRSLPFEIRK